MEVESDRGVEIGEWRWRQIRECMEVASDRGEVVSDTGVKVASDRGVR